MPWGGMGLGKLGQAGLGRFEGCGGWGVGEVLDHRAGREGVQEPKSGCHIPGGGVSYTPGFEGEAASPNPPVLVSFEGGFGGW
jgi:hypothetical protein